MRGHTVLAHHHALFTLRRVELVQGQFYMLLDVVPLAQHQRVITLVTVALAHDLVHRD